MRKENPTIVILQILKSEYKLTEESIITKKAFMRILNKILSQFNIYSTSALYSYYNKLKRDGAIEESEDGTVKINFSKFKI
jgi:hypothetical protein